MSATKSARNDLSLLQMLVANSLIFVKIPICAARNSVSEKVVCFLQLYFRVFSQPMSLLRHILIEWEASNAQGECAKFHGSGEYRVKSAIPSNLTSSSNEDRILRFFIAREIGLISSNVEKIIPAGGMCAIFASFCSNEIARNFVSRYVS